MNALLIKFDLKTGIRAGGINPKDPKLPCHGWQDLEREPAIEIRLVMDDRDLTIYEKTKGVVVLYGTDVINEAIEDFIPTRYAVKDKELLLAHLKEKGISLDTLAKKTLNDVAKELYDKGFAGIIKREPELLV